MTVISVDRISGCRHCGSPDVAKFLSLPKLPLTDAFLRPGDDLSQEFLYPIEIYLCSACGVAQTQHDVDVKSYYRDYQYTSGASGFAYTFMRRLAEETWRRFDLKAGDTVVEVGSGDGVQLSCFQGLGARVLGFEPSAALCAASRARNVAVLQKLFLPGAESDIPEVLRPVQVALLTYTFDHLADPVGFARSIKPILDPRRGLLLIEVHDFEKIFTRREFCLFEHEHTIYPTTATLQRMLASAGYALLEVGILPEKERRANSLLVAATPMSSDLARHALPTLDTGIYSDPSACQAFGQSVFESIQRIKSYVQSRRAEGKRLAGYGAGGRGVMTLAATSSAADFAYVCDQNKSFHGFLTPGAHIPVVEPARVFADPVDELIVFSFGYIDEIRAQYADFQQAGARITSLLEIL